MNCFTQLWANRYRVFHSSCYHKFFEGHSSRWSKLKKRNPIIFSVGHFISTAAHSHEIRAFDEQPLSSIAEYTILKLRSSAVQN